MGISIVAWRVTIGTFVQPDKRSGRLLGLKVPVKLCLNGLRWIVFVAILLTLCGDIEQNPGPTSGVKSGRASGTRQDIRQDNGPQAGQNEYSGARTRQRTLTSFSSNPQYPEASNGSQRNSTGAGVRGQHNNNKDQDQDMFAFLRNMKSDLDVHNARLTSEMSQVNSKIDSITDSINNLRLENEQLKTENQAMRSEIADLRGQFDKLEGHSRRNNVRIDGIPGFVNEKWSDCENKVRDFIKTDLDMPEKEHVEIERAHRVKSRDPSKCTILVKFSKYKDRDCVIERAKTQLSRDSSLSVKPDYIDRVRRHRYELGQRMVSERQNNNYAAISYDKLIVNDKIFKYDDQSKSIVCIGRRQQTRGQEAHGRGVNNNNEQEGSEDHVSNNEVPAQEGDWGAHGTEGVFD